MIQSTLIDLHTIEYTQRLCYYPLPVNLERCVGGFNTLNDLSNEVCVTVYYHIRHHKIKWNWN